METDEAVAAARGLAIRMHASQTDKAGLPYIGHLERTAAMVHRSGGTWVQEAAAWLHDSLEDTESTRGMLEQYVPSSVINIVLAMTHLPGTPNVEYWQQVRENPAAVLVKLCDIYDNLDPSRMCYLSQADQVRMRLKYAEAMKVLLG